MTIDHPQDLPPGLVLPSRLDPTGRHGPTPGQARGPGWRRTSRGYYVPSSVDGGRPEQRILEAAVLLPKEGGITGWAALRWWGGRWFEGTAASGREVPVWLVTAAWDIRQQAGVRITAEHLRPDDVTVHRGIRVATPLCAAAFEMRRATSVRHAVRVADMAAYSDLVSLDELRDYLGTQQTWTGVPRAREAVALAVENAWSPAEVDLRLIWELAAGLPRPQCNVPVFDRSGALIGVPDILDIEAGVVGEYDGPLHLAGEQRARDIRREDRFRRHGLEYFTMVARDREDVAGLVDRIMATRARARWESESQRSWTVEPPRWWTPTTTVAQRRALSAEKRERLLAHRLQAA